MAKKINIRRVHNKGLCTQCGLCDSVCNYDAIYMKKLHSFKPIVSQDCTSCKHCLRSCPGEVIDFNKLNNFVFHKKDVHPVYGEVASCNLINSKNNDFLKKASSGGAVTALLCYLLDKKEIDGALVVGLDNNKPYSYIARDKKGLMKAQGSKYLPFPISEGLKEIRQCKGTYAVVGLPCHIHGIRKAQMHDPIMKERIKYCFGLFCGYAMSSLGTRYLFESLGVNEDDVKFIGYRSGEKPNGFMIETFDGKIKKIPKHDYGYITQLFPPKRCTMCIDQTNELADLSFGDAWGIKKNSTLTLCRTSRGQILLNKAIKAGYVNHEIVSNDSIFKSQGGMLVYKKKTVNARIKLLRKFSREWPFYRGAQLNNNYSILAYAGALMLYFNMIIMKNDFVRKTVAKSPKILVKNYCRLICKLNEDRIFSNKIDSSTFDLLN